MLIFDAKIANNLETRQRFRNFHIKLVTDVHSIDFYRCHNRVSGINQHQFSHYANGLKKTTTNCLNISQIKLFSQNA